MRRPPVLERKNLFNEAQQLMILVDDKGTAQVYLHGQKLFALDESQLRVLWEVDTRHG